MTRHHACTPRPRTFARPLARAVAVAATTSLVALGVSVSATTSARDTSGPATGQALRLTSTTSLTADTYEQRVQRLVNLRRADHGLRRLRFASCPDGTAERWSRYLAVNDAFFHQSMTNVLDTCGAVYAGETLGRGAMSPHRLVQMWMESPAHRDILMSAKPRRIGIGATRDVFGRWVVAANFLRF